MTELPRNAVAIILLRFKSDSHRIWSYFAARPKPGAAVSAEPPLRALAPPAARRLLPPRATPLPGFTPFSAADRPQPYLSAYLPVQTCSAWRQTWRPSGRQGSPRCPACLQTSSSATPSCGQACHLLGWVQLWRTSVPTPVLLCLHLSCCTASFAAAGSPAIRQALGVPAGASDAEALGAIRAAKDSFR